MASHVDRELQLQAEGSALRRLARSLLFAGADADDLVQDTFFASLMSGRGDAVDRPWLSGTLRNLALLRRRTSARRAARERVAAAKATPTSADPMAIAVQSEAMREVAAAVHDLEEPFRTVIVLRFWRGLLPEAIARELGVPRNTVRSRLQRGLDKLRARLDREYGDRRGWILALVPFARPGGFAAAAAAPGAATACTAIGALLMTKLKFVLATAALAAVGMLAWWWEPKPTAPAPTTAEARHSAAVAVLDNVPERAGADAVANPGGEVVREERVPAEPEAGLTVAGKVTSRGAPCADLALTMQWFDGAEAVGEPASEHEVRSDADGRFVWRGPVRTAVGTLRAVRSGAAGDAKIWCTPQLVQPGQAQVALEVTLLALDRSLSGRVHDVGGAPIAGAELAVNGWDDVATHTDADGRYEMKVTGPPYPLLVVKPGYRERLLEAYMPEGKQRHELDIELEPGASFSGRVVDEAGHPVAGAQVRASGLQHGTVTDAAGHFEFGGAAPEDRHQLTAAKPGFQMAALTASPGADPVELVLRPGLALVVRVLGAGGEGIAGARISVRPDRFHAMQVRGFTDAGGRLRLEDLPAGEIEVVADKPGFVKVTSAADAAKTPGELALVLHAGRTIAGCVLDEAGAPIVGASVYCERATPDLERRSIGGRATSDTEGRFTIADLPPEPCTVFAHHADHMRASLEGVAGSPSDLVLRMKRAASVAGRVVDGVTGAPVGAFTILLTADYSVQPLQYVDPVRFVDSDGWFRVVHWQLQPGAELFVEVWAEGYAPQRVAGAPSVDAPRDQYVIRLFAGATVRGVVCDAANGAPVEQVEVTLQSGDPKDPARHLSRGRSRDVPGSTRVYTDAGGRFELHSVPPGENRLVLAHGDYPKRTFGPFEIAAGAPVVEVQPTLTHGATLRGHVTGMPDAAGKRISAHVFDGKTIETEVGSDGTFELRGVGAGRVSLSLTTGKGRWHSMRLEVGDDDVSDLVFAVPQRSTGSILASVVGMARGRAAVSTLGVEPGRCSTTRSIEFEDAGFLVDGLPAGKYEVEVVSPGSGASGRAEVTVGDGRTAVTVAVAPR
ncbi:MAG TPA: sigma-70 family RNA polymerase sigma factor [Planctomycetota bacterium]|nr:sigma-70 family RNA polymerase sigma factor [Planctomycetota bacterium]